MSHNLVSSITVSSWLTTDSEPKNLRTSTWPKFTSKILLCRTGWAIDDLLTKHWSSGFPISDRESWGLLMTSVSARLVRNGTSSHLNPRLDLNLNKTRTLMGLKLYKTLELARECPTRAWEWNWPVYYFHRIISILFLV